MELHIAKSAYYGLICQLSGFFDPFLDVRGCQLIIKVSHAQLSTEQFLPRSVAARGASMGRRNERV